MWFQNMGGRDRVVRLLAAVALGIGAAADLGGPVVRVILIVLAALLFLTSLTGFCLVYRIAHIKTIPRHVGEPDQWDRY
jgi:fructose-specific phosphotransferase system IIC component